IQRSTEFLAKKGVDSPRLQTELLLAQVLDLPRMQLYLNFERSLTQTEIETLREFVRRRGQHEPLQYIVGSTSFCGLEIAVNRHVLIPRPETELLAERGWQFLNQRTDARLKEELRGRDALLTGGMPALFQSVTALDYGTGSGCLAIALAVNCPGAQVCALDIFPDGLALAQKN